MRPGSTRNETSWSTSSPARSSSTATSSSEASETLSAAGYANRTPVSSTDTGPAGRSTGWAGSAISGSMSSTSKTRSKLTSAVTTSRRAVPSAVSGPYSWFSSSAIVTTVPASRRPRTAR